MLSSEMFCVLVFLDAVLFIVGCGFFDRGSETEKIIMLLIASVLSFLLALECFAGIGTITNQWIGLFFGGFGAVQFILFILKLLENINNLLKQDPDYFRNYRG